MPRTTTPRKKKTEVSRPIEDTLTEMYQDDDGQMPDMKHIEHRGSRTGMVISFFVLFFLAAAAGAAWLGFFLFSPSQKFSENNVVVNVVPPVSIVNGVEQQYKITLANSGSLALANTEIALKLPENFVITESKPEANNERNDSWTLGALDGDESKTIVLTGVLAATKDSQVNLRTYVDFRPSNFNSDFEKVVDTNLTVAAEAVELNAEKKITADGKNEITVTYKNITDTKLMKGVVRVITGAGFKTSKTTPTAKTQSGSVLLELPELEPAKENKFVIIGAYGPNAVIPENLEVLFERAALTKTLTLAKTELKNDKPEGQVKAPKPLAVSSNGVSDVSIKKGDSVKLTITYKNTTDKPVKNITLVVTGDTPSVKNKSAFDFTNLATSGDPDVIGKQISPDVREAKITWHPEKTPLLREVAPGEMIIIEATVTLKQSEDILKQNSASFIASLSADGDVLQLSDPLSVTITP